MQLMHDLDFTLNGCQTNAYAILHPQYFWIYLHPDYMIDLAFWSIQMQHIELKENMVH